MRTSLLAASMLLVTLLAAPRPALGELSGNGITDEVASEYVENTADSILLKLLFARDPDLPRFHIAQRVLRLASALSAQLERLITSDATLSPTARDARLARLADFEDFDTRSLDSLSDVTTAVADLRAYLRSVSRWAYVAPNSLFDEAHAYRDATTCFLNALEDWLDVPALRDMEIPDFTDCALQNLLARTPFDGSEPRSLLFAPRAAYADTTAIRKCKWYICEDGACRPYCPDITQEP